MSNKLAHAPLDLPAPPNLRPRLNSIDLLCGVALYWY